MDYRNKPAKAAAKKFIKTHMAEAKAEAAEMGDDSRQASYTAAGVAMYDNLKIKKIAGIYIYKTVAGWYADATVKNSNNVFGSPSAIPFATEAEAIEYGILVLAMAIANSQNKISRDCPVNPDWYGIVLDTDEGLKAVELGDVTVQSAKYHMDKDDTAEKLGEAFKDDFDLANFLINMMLFVFYDKDTTSYTKQQATTSIFAMAALIQTKYQSKCEYSKWIYLHRRDDGDLSFGSLADAIEEGFDIYKIPLDNVSRIQEDLSDKVYH